MLQIWWSFGRYFQAQGCTNLEMAWWVAFSPIAEQVMADEGKEQRLFVTALAAVAINLESI